MKLNSMLIVFTTIIMSLLFFGCTSLMDPIEIFKANEQVQGFLKQYPNADITLVRLSAEKIEPENNIVTQMCGITLENKEHYKITMNDASSNLEFYAYIDAQSNKIICLKKIGNEQKSPSNITNTEKDETENATIHTNYKKENIECQQDIKLEGKENENGIITLKWSNYNCDDFLGYKVVYSTTNPNPEYPKDSYIKYITEQNNNYFEIPSDKYKDGNNWYRITVITKEHKIHSNVLKFYNEKSFQNNNNHNQDNKYQLKYKFNDDGNLVLEWDKYKGDNFAYYKIVWNQEKSDIQYPEDGYIGAISNIEQNYFKVPHDKIKEKNYYRITIVTTDYYSGNINARYNTNYIKIEKDYQEKNEELKITFNIDNYEILTDKDFKLNIFTNNKAICKAKHTLFSNEWSSSSSTTKLSSEYEKTHEYEFTISNEHTYKIEVECTDEYQQTKSEYVKFNVELEGDRDFSLEDLKAEKETYNIEDKFLALIKIKNNANFQDTIEYNCLIKEPSKNEFELVGDSSKISLGAQGSHTVKSCEFQLKNQGEYTIKIILDPNNKTTETNENNNEKIIKFNVLSTEICDEQCINNQTNCSTNCSN